MGEIWKWSSFIIIIPYSQCLKVLEVLIAQSCQTLRDPMDCSPLGSSAHGILQAKILEWGAISFSRGILQTQRSNSGLPHWKQILSHQGSPPMS